MIREQQIARLLRLRWLPENSKSPHAPWRRHESQTRLIVADILERSLRREPGGAQHLKNFGFVVTRQSEPSAQASIIRKQKPKKLPSEIHSRQQTAARHEHPSGHDLVAESRHRRSVDRWVAVICEITKKRLSHSQRDIALPNAARSGRWSALAGVLPLQGQAHEFSDFRSFIAKSCGQFGSSPRRRLTQD